MSSITKDIKKLLADDALRQSLSKEALQELLTELDTNEIVMKDQENTIEALNATEKALRLEYQGVKAARDLNINLVNDLTTKLGDIEAREKACITLEIRNEYEKRRGDEFKDLQHATVRNATVRKTIFGEQVVTETPSSTRNDGSFNPGTMARKEPTTSNVTETEE